MVPWLVVSGSVILQVSPKAHMRWLVKYNSKPYIGVFAILNQMHMQPCLEMHPQKIQHPTHVLFQEKQILIQN